MTKKITPIRWWPLALIGIGAGLLAYAIQGRGWALTRPSQDIVYIWGIANVLLYVWVRAWSHLTRTTQIRVILSFFTLQLLSSLAIRVDGYAGDGRVIVKWRWTPTAEQQWNRHNKKWQAQQVNSDTPVATADDSPAFRGPNRTGVFSRPNIDWNWNETTPRVIWRRPVGLGWSSFATVGNYCITQEQRGAKEAVVCYDLQSGNEIWQHVDISRFDEVTSGAGPRATPAIDLNRVFTLGPTGRLNCLDLTTGQPLWSTPLTDDTPPPVFGYSGSPLVHNHLVYVSLGHPHGSLVAVDRESGTVHWRTGSRPTGYSSPHWLTVPHSNQSQVLVFDGAGLHGHAADHGETLWSFPFGDQSDDHVNVGQPVVLCNNLMNAESDQSNTTNIRLLVSSGYGRGTVLLSLRHHQDSTWTTHEIWRSRGLKSKFSCVVAHNDYAYGLDEGILTCIALTDGQRQWKRGRYGYGQLLLVDDKLLIQAESGHIHVVLATPTQHQELATVNALNDRTWNHPVITGNYLLVRNDREAICMELPERLPSQTQE